MTTCLIFKLLTGEVGYRLKDRSLCCLLVLVSILAGSEASWARDGGIPRTFHLSLQNLELSRARFRNGDTAMVAAVARLTRMANVALTRGPYAVTQKSYPSPSGDQHDFVSYAIYMWPNPATLDGLPWIYRDGYHNPDAQIDWKLFYPMAGDVETLSLAYYFTGNERYARHASHLLRTWFIAPETRMNPNMTYARLVPGRPVTTTSLPEFMINMALVYDGAGILESSPLWSDIDRRALQRFTSEFLVWMETAPEALPEAKSKNNHGTYYRFGQVMMWRYLRNSTRAKAALNDYIDNLLPGQFAPDGTQPREMGRVNNYVYHINNLTAAFSLAQVARGLGGVRSLWNFVTPGGAGLRKSTDFLVPYLTGQKKWPYFEGEAFSIPASKRGAALRRAALGFNDLGLAAAARAVIGSDVASRLNLTYPEVAIKPSGK